MFLSQLKKVSFFHTKKLKKKKHCFTRNENTWHKQNAYQQCPLFLIVRNFFFNKNLIPDNYEENIFIKILYKKDLSFTLNLWFLFLTNKVDQTVQKKRIICISICTFLIYKKSYKLMSIAQAPTIY